MALIFCSELPASALQPLLDALLNQIPEDESSGVPVITVKQDSMPSSPAHPSKAANNQPVYDPAVVYVLEFCTALALRDDRTIELLGKKVSDVLQAVIRDSSRYHPILASRAAYYQFSILNASYVSVARRPLGLQTIRLTESASNTTLYEPQFCSTQCPAGRRTPWPRLRHWSWRA